MDKNPNNHQSIQPVTPSPTPSSPPSVEYAPTPPSEQSANTPINPVPTTTPQAPPLVSASPSAPEGSPEPVATNQDNISANPALPVAPPAPGVSAPPSDATGVGSPRNRLAVLLLTTAFGSFGIHQLYLGNKTQGWVRLGVALASIPLTVIFIGFFTYLAMMIWALVDWFRIAFGDMKDSAGQSLVADEKDQLWVKRVAIITVAAVVLVVILNIVVIGLTAYSGIQQRALGSS